MNLPFTIGDLLERVIPGTIFQVYVLLFLFGKDSGSIVSNSTVTGIALQLGTAYALGVLLNSLANLTNLADNRKYWALDRTQGPTNPMRRAIVKHGYSANTQLFQGLYVFCRTMSVNCALGSVLSAVSLFADPFANQLQSPAISWSILIGSIGCTLLFYYGAWVYSRSFVGSIYEGFYSWYCEQSSVNNKKSISEDQNAGRK